MSQPSRRTLWTGSSVMLAAAAFVSTLVLVEGLPSRGDAAAPATQRIALVSKTDAEPALVAQPVAQSAAQSVAQPVVTPAQFVVKRILPIEGAIKYGEWHWDEAGAPAAGTTVVTVDLKANVLSVFRDGYEIGATAILTGYGDKPTPLGVFPITQKDLHHVSNLYEAPMPYMLRLTNDGVSIHSTKVENGYVTHGCIGVPDAFAKKLFAQARLGDKVIVTDGAKMGMGDKIV